MKLFSVALMVTSCFPLVVAIMGTWTWRHVLKLFNGCSALPPYSHDMEASVCV